MGFRALFVVAPKQESRFKKLLEIGDRKTDNYVGPVSTGKPRYLPVFLSLY
jgi:hypothetical protein